jgi:transcriptional regulator with XRE-family HTH domain
MALSSMDRRLYELLGQTIADKRDNKAFTQQQLADKVSLTRTSITNIERGRQHIQLHTLYLLAKALSVEVVDMLPSRKSVENAGGEKSITLSKEEWLKNTILGDVK